MESATDNFMPISVATLSRGAHCGFNIYLRAKPTESAVLFCASNQEIGADKVESMAAQEKLFIRCQDRDRYQLFLRECYSDCISGENVPILNRVSVLNEVVRDILSEQFATGKTESIVGNCQTLGKDMAVLFGNESIVPNELSRVLHHDFGTFTHSANVSAYAVILGRVLGYSDSDLEQIAVGALLHDIGKLDISDQLLNKPGKLTEAEFAQVRKHPTAGLERVGLRTDLSFGQMMMIYQHHERMNGSGYPVGCASTEIHPWAKLCAIVDVFEALTSHRPYRIPFSHATAFATLQKGSEIEFDKTMLDSWRKVLAV